MAAKQKSELNNPDGAKDLSAVVTKPRVAKEPATSFDERTKRATPYLDEAGNQVNGSEDVPQPADIEPQIAVPDENGQVHNEDNAQVEESEEEEKETGKKPTKRGKIKKALSKIKRKK